MSSLIMLDVTKSCRVCLRCNVNMKSLFESYQSLTTAEMLSELTASKIRNSNMFPHLICLQCFNLVVSAYELKKQYEKSHTTLMGLLNFEKNVITKTCKKCSLDKSTQTEESFIYSCKYCNETFLTSYALKVHSQNQHSDNMETCRFCSRSFEYVNSFYQCNICKRQFTTSFHKEKHIQTIHKFLAIENQTSIEDLKAELHMLQQDKTTKQLKTNPIERDSEMQLYDIDNFGSLSDDEDDIPLALLTESSNVTQIIEETLSNIEKLSETQNIMEDNQGIDNEKLLDHDSISENSEISIDTTQQTKQSLVSKQLPNKKIAFNKRSKNINKPFPCSKCEKKYSTQNSLDRHIENHDKKRFVCKECSHEFLTKEELNIHAKIEGHDKPLLCPECGLRCKSSNILTVHLRRHKGEKPFKCKYCSKGFPRIDDVKIHEKYHTGEKNHFCDICGKGFFRKYNLRIHMRIHTGEKPYKCPHCPQAFAQSNDLKAHIRRHTGERFPCEICNASFLQGYQIRQHKLQEHGIHEIPPTQRVMKFTSAEEQQKQIQQNLQSILE